MNDWSNYNYSGIKCYFEIVAIEVPGGKRSLVMNMMTQQMVLSKDMMHTYVKSLIVTFRYLLSNIFRVSIYNVGIL